MRGVERTKTSLVEKKTDRKERKRVEEWERGKTGREKKREKERERNIQIEKQETPQTYSIKFNGLTNLIQLTWNHYTYIYASRLSGSSLAQSCLKLIAHALARSSHQFWYL